MKKSEVIAQLENLLTIQRQDLNNGSDYQDAEFIINWLVDEIGMMPPKIMQGDYLAHDEYQWENE